MNMTFRAVAVVKDDEIVGHVPREISRTLYFFLKQSGSCGLCAITGRRKLGNRLEVPCMYRMSGSKRCIKKFKMLLSKAYNYFINVLTHCLFSLLLS